MITSLVLENGKKLVKDPDMDKLRKLAKSGRNIIWLDVMDGTDEEYDFLKEVFGFHSLVIEDCRQNQELPKIERYKDYIFVVFHKFEYDKEEREISTKEIDTFLGKSYLVTEHKGPFYAVERLRKILESRPEMMARGADSLLHNILDYTVDQYLPLLDSWDVEIESLEDKIIAGDVEGALEKLVDFRRRVSEMKRSILPQRHTIYKLTKAGDYNVISDTVARYFGDVYDHIMKAQGILESQRDLVSSAFQAYSSHASNQMNEVMKTLTIIATIFIPLTFIVGVYGMNFRYMPELDSVLGYPLVWAVMLVIGVIMFSYFKRKRWL